MKTEDSHLVSRSLEGDTEAYGELVKRYQSSVYATAFYYVGKYGAAEDIAQDAMLAAFNSLPRLKYPEKFGPWLKEITCRMPTTRIIMLKILDPKMAPMAISASPSRRQA